VTRKRPKSSTHAEEKRRKRKSQPLQAEGQIHHRQLKCGPDNQIKSPIVAVKFVRKFYGDKVSFTYMNQNVLI
ncbi:unnamed protein product, partial [Prunus brigantina]